MKKPKLSPAQVKVLRALAEPGNYAHFISGLDAYWFFHAGARRRVGFATMDVLITAGFVNAKKDQWGQYKQGHITQAGRDYLWDLAIDEAFAKGIKEDTDG